MNKILLFYILIFFFPTSLLGAIKLDVSLVYKKGIDKQLVLVSELHSSQILNEGQEASLKMKNGISVFLRPYFLSTTDVFGPSNMIEVKGRIVRDGVIFKTGFENGKVILKLGETKEISLKQGDDQLLLISLTGFVR